MEPWAFVKSQSASIAGANVIKSVTIPAHDQLILLRLVFSSRFRICGISQTISRKGKKWKGGGLLPHVFCMRISCLS